MGLNLSNKISITESMQSIFSIVEIFDYVLKYDLKMRFFSEGCAF